MATLEQAAYFAGLMDGEGTFTVSKSAGIKGPVYSTRLCLASTNMDVLAWSKATFGGSVNLMRPTGNRQPHGQWFIMSKELVIPLLLELLPYLIIKQWPAKLLLKYCREFRDAKRGRRLTPTDIELRDAYVQLFSALNSVGQGATAQKAEVIKLCVSGGM
jgi:hypothetical protein